MRSLILPLLALLALTPAAALAGDLTVTLRTPAGQPVSDAVVSFKPAAGVSGPIKFPWSYVMEQKEVHFDPFVLIVPAGAEVSFPNRDKVRHHVFSFSPGNRFEIKLYGRDETRKIPFTHTGVVSLGCNIHDQMMGFVVVVDTPFATRVGPGGKVTLTGIPAGGGTLTVWQPFQRTPGNTQALKIDVPAQGAAKADVTLNLRPPPEAKTPLL